MAVRFFFFNDTATTEIYTLSLHDALPILAVARRRDELADDLGQRMGQVALAITGGDGGDHVEARHAGRRREARDRKSTRLNSSHANISYAVFCLKKTQELPYKTPSRQQLV